MGRSVLLTSTLPQLQNLIKRDPTAYKEEFLQQWNHYNSIRQIFQFNLDDQAQHFRELVMFLSQVATCYPSETAEFPSHLSTLLLENYGNLPSDTRKTLVQSLVILRNKDVITSIELLKCFFPLLSRTTSSTLRTFIRKTILSDLKRANLRSKNHKLNRAVQAMLFRMVEQSMEGDFGDKGKAKTSDRTPRSGDEAMWAVIVTKELWKKGIWDDAKTVSIIVLGCFHPVLKVRSAAIHFLLGDDSEDEDSADENDLPDVRTLHHRREINKKTRSGEKKLRKTLHAVKKKRKVDVKTANFPALRLLNDPQTFAERLYDMLTRHDKLFALDHKILIMQLLSRVMGAHNLCILGFYTYVVKYLTRHQLHVPAILVALVQSVHELSPPDSVTPVVRKIAQEFVHPGVGSEVIAAGLNAIREVCRRQPWSMEEELLGDLVEYRKSRDKGVMSAARGLLQLYRDVNPGMLKRREQGKSASMGIAKGVRPLPFGHSADAAVDIEGLALLEEHLKQLHNDESVETGGGDEGDDGWAGWEIESDSSDESSHEGGWIDVDSDGDHLELSDSEAEKETKEDPKAQAAADGAKQSGSEGQVSTLATTKILTPADFALINDLRVQDATKAVELGGGSRAKRKLAEARRTKQNNQHAEDTFISENDILGPRKKAKADYAERIASIEKGREGRERFGSLKGKKKKEVPSSSTNKQKARNKPIMMVLSSGAVRGKKKQSLREKQQKLRAHISRAKR